MKYAALVAALFLPRRGIERWRRQLLRATYIYFRYLDDVIDRDRWCPDEPGALLDQQAAQWRASQVIHGADDELSILLNFVFSEFSKRNLPVSRAGRLALQIIEGLRFDLDRGVQKRTVRQSELQNYYEKVVLAPALLAHLILDSKVAPEPLREISCAIGELQSIRDLSVDQALGKVNIPAEVWDRNWGDEEIADWRSREALRCAARLQSLWSDWSSHADETSRRIMQPAVETLLKWTAKHYQDDASEAIRELVLN